MIDGHGARSEKAAYGPDSVPHVTGGRRMLLQSIQGDIVARYEDAVLGHCHTVPHGGKTDSYGYFLSVPRGSQPLQFSSRSSYIVAATSRDLAMISG